MTDPLRFRNRNAITNYGKRRIQQFGLINGSSCANPTYGWFDSSVSSNQIVWDKADTIDDVPDDPPNREIGYKGWKFHPMIRSLATLSGGTNCAWQVSYPTGICGAGTPVASVRRMPSPEGNFGLHNSTLILPDMGDGHLDYSQLGYPDVKVGELRALAETACLAKRGRTGDSNLYESLSEVNKTLGTYRDIVQRARRIQNTAFFGKNGSTRLRSFTDEAAGQYLATRYGFMPLVRDLEALTIGLEKPLGSAVIRSVATERWAETKTISLPDLNDSNHVLWTRTLTSEETLEVKAISLDLVELTLLRNLGLGFKDLWSFPLEKVKYSFVADWFANVGSFWAALAPDVGVSNVGFVTVVTWTKKETVNFAFKSLSAQDQSDGVVLNSISPPDPVVREIYRKERLVGLPAPRLQQKLDFKFNNVVRVLDALSLFNGEASKIRPRLQPPSALEQIRRLRMRNPSQRGRRSVEDYRNVTD